MKRFINFLINFLIIVAFIAAGGYIGFHFGKPVNKYILPPWIRIPLQQPPEKVVSILGVFPDSSMLIPVGDTLYVQSTSGNIYRHTNFFTGWQQIDENEYQTMDRTDFLETSNKPTNLHRNLLFIRKPVAIFDIIYERPLSIIWHTYVINPNGNISIWIRENDVNWMLFSYALCIFWGAYVGLLPSIKLTQVDTIFTRRYLHSFLHVISALRLPTLTGTGRRAKSTLSFARALLVAVTVLILCVGGNLG